MPCDEALRVHAYFDGELDAAVSLEVEEHVESCSPCAALLKDLQAMHETMRHASYYRAPSHVRAALTEALNREDGPHAPRAAAVLRGSPFWRGAGAGSVITALAAALALFIAMPSGPDRLENDLTVAHLRSLMPDHLIDVASSDQHTVKPWFAGHTDVSPPTPDFPKEDYRLVGGRADYIDGSRAAVVIYRHGAHVINVFAWPYHAQTFPEMVTRNGYHMAFWRSGDIAFCAVSDTAADELMRLVRLLQDAASRENRE
jgi:anti-sigma factor RsiW